MMEGSSQQGGKKMKDREGKIGGMNDKSGEKEKEGEWRVRELLKCL